MGGKLWVKQLFDASSGGPTRGAMVQNHRNGDGQRQRALAGRDRAQVLVEDPQHVLQGAERHQLVNAALMLEEQVQEA